MRRALFITCMVATAIAAHAQTTEQQLKELKKKRVTNYVITGTLMLFSGAADGVNQALMYQYGGFKHTFPRSRDQFWKPSVSCVNKYKNGDPNQGAKFPGSRTWLVFLTDGYHLTRFVDHLFLSGAIAFKIAGYEKKKWYHYLLEAAAYWTVNRLGFCVTYNHFRRNL